MAGLSSEEDELLTAYQERFQLSRSEAIRALIRTFATNWRDPSMTESELTCGEPWTESYGGTRYSCRGDAVWWRAPRDAYRLPVIDGHEPVLEAMRSLGRFQGGRFRVTPQRHVITRVDSDDDGIAETPVYLCRLEHGFTFADLPKLGSLASGALWPSFYDGFRYSFQGDRIWWKDPANGARWYWRGAASGLTARLRRFKPHGGSFRVTEDGHVITLIDLKTLSRDVGGQFRALPTKQQNIVHQKVMAVEMLPIYVCDLDSEVALDPPRSLYTPLEPEERERFIEFITQFSSHPTTSPAASESMASAVPVADDPWEMSGEETEDYEVRLDEEAQP